MKIKIIFSLCMGILFGNVEIENLQKQCEAGSGKSCARLGAIYIEGKGARKDLKKAKEFYGRACDLKLQKGKPMQEHHKKL